MVTGPQRHTDPMLVKLKSGKNRDFKVSWVLISLIPIGIVILVFWPRLILPAALLTALGFGIRFFRKRGKK